MSQYVFYGTESNAKEVRHFTEHILTSNETAEAKGLKKNADLHLGDTRHW